MTLEELEALRQPEILQWLRQIPPQTDPSRFLLQHHSRTDIPVRAMATQLALRPLIARKFPEWYGTDMLFTRRALEQSSGAEAARFKQRYFQGKVLDLCGGLGSDILHHNTPETHFVYCDMDPVLCALFKHNCTVLGKPNIQVHCGDGIEILKSFPDHSSDVVYADPDRRTGTSRHISLEDSSPDIPSNLDLIFTKTRQLLIKASPVLDPDEAIRVLPGLNRYEVVSVDGENKEILLHCKVSPVENIAFSAAILRKNTLSEWIKTDLCTDLWIDDADPAYFAEPDPAIIRAGITSAAASEFNLMHIAPGSIYLAGNHFPTDFPGRVFSVDAILPANTRTVRQWLKQHNIASANIARRQFPQTPETLKKALNLNDGGSWYLFFCTFRGKSVCVVSHKAG